MNIEKVENDLYIMYYNNKGQLLFTYNKLTKETKYY